MQHVSCPSAAEMGFAPYQVCTPLPLQAAQLWTEEHN